ncbi:hypothetical protein FZ934_24330 (plasmid) [Rhizobium grahamii]|uniref:Uncharacterized protein n=1 Tax=Rhizobium grahamii TaxID=1120045 RepID=A0A5Q0CBZ2_9HYPH|nr:hypothetical protein [Rhizobium grahamii]QFY63398.1 hypothetical protein FZ934_24330 [Rhizobium grahamii]QRM51837.1 hypothetical protein F3Y33_21315 [Rhizobium sp. BG6]
MITAIGGCFLVILGTVLAVDQLGYAVPYRGLFLVLLAPAISAIVDSVRVANVVGWRHVLPISRFVTGVIFGLIGILMSLRLNTGLILPALIVALGIVTIVRAFFGRIL